MEGLGRDVLSAVVQDGDAELNATRDGREDVDSSADFTWGAVE